MKNRLFVLLLAVVSLLPQVRLSAQGRPLELEDIMKFRHTGAVAVSRDGHWIAHEENPDRGNPDVCIYRSDGKRKYHVTMAGNPVISNDGQWVAMTIPVPALDKERAGKDASKLPKIGMALLHTSDGEEIRIDSVKSFKFSNDSRYLFLQKYDKEIKGKKNAGKKDDPADQSYGSTLQVLSLGVDKHEYAVTFVESFAVDSSTKYLAFVVSDTLTANNGVFIHSLYGDFNSERILDLDSSTWASNLTFSDRTGELIFLAGDMDDEGNKVQASLYSWRSRRGEVELLLADEQLEPGWKIWHKNQLKWSDDGMHIYLGTKPADEILPPDPEEKDTITGLFNTEEILEKKQVDVWHWDDPYIITHQKKQWKEEKDRTYTGVLHLRNNHFVQLADPGMPRIHIGHSDIYTAGYSNVPYRKRVTWDGNYNDIYIVNMEAGERQLVEKEVQHSVSISPDGKYLVYYKKDHWYLFHSETGDKVCLTAQMDVPFYDEDWDYPEERPGYGVAGWVDRSSSVLIYDKFDIWSFPTSGGDPVCLTEGMGRNEKYQFRIRNLDPDQHWYKSGTKLLLSAYHDQEKHTAIFGMELGKPGITSMLEGAAKYSIIAKAKDADQYVFTRQTYKEFPDLQVAAYGFKKPLKLTNLGSQTEGIAWGSAELVDWLSADGRPIQGILIRPGNYEPGKKYPVLVYYYRFFTDRLYNFPQVVINHRPNFPYYTSNGYAIFLPDIRFDIGTPGYSATKCIVPGVQELIDMGVADPDAIALHGHSWSGYQTAFVITQTDMFACAIAGAPVSNMTSAYSGIRWGSGLARQFQYEKSQSRIGGSLWEARDKFIENSPVFFADRIETPLLIQFGDEDEAVPWYQGIELYLAMRRLEKDCIFLQYRGEPHHLKQYANKLDYTIRFRQYLDHYLKGEEPADWITNGIPYQGK